MKNIFFTTLILCFTLQVQSQSEPINKNGYVLTQSGNLNVRNAPVNGKVITKLKKNEKFTILQEAEDDYNWFKIKTSNNTIGYVSKAYVAYQPLKNIQTAKVLGVLSPGSKKSYIGRVLGVRFNQSWADSYDSTAEYLYIGRKLFKTQKSIQVYGNGSVVGSLKFNEFANWGCQEIRGFRGDMEAKNINEDDTLIFSIGSKIQPIQLKPLKDNSKALSILKDKSKQFFLDQSVTEAELSSIQVSSAVYFKHPIDKKNYLSARFVIRNKEAEKHYVYLFARSTGKDIEVIFHKAETLGEEQGMYGGSFHIRSVFMMDRDKTPMVLFGNIGFDAHIYTIYILDDDDFKLIVTGAGDAC